MTHADSTVDEIEYAWGKDISGRRNGAAGIGGFLYLKRNGVVYIPYADAYGNILGYWDANGNLVASYTYNAFGKTIAQQGAMADSFALRYSTKCFDDESGLVYYGYRCYNPALMQWLMSDPLEELPCFNLYQFCNNQPLSNFDMDGRWSWTEGSARKEVQDKIDEMRKNGYSFAADALEHYLGNHTTNVDLSRHSREISNNEEWQKSYVNSVLAELKRQDPNGTNRKVEIGDVSHKASFDADLSSGNLDDRFTQMFAHRFYPTQSMSLFYALYGSRYSYVGTASWCRKSSRVGLGSISEIRINTDLRIACWDPLSYAGGFPRTIFPSYSAAQYLHANHGYRYTYVYLRWIENSHWLQTAFRAPRSEGSFLRRE